jgi:flagellar protein FlaH
MEPETETTLDQTPADQQPAAPVADAQPSPLAAAEDAPAPAVEADPPATAEGQPAPVVDVFAGMEPPEDMSAEEEEDPAEEIPTLIVMGVTDVDKRLGGGLPLETITLVEGDPESGKSVVIEQLAFNALRVGLRVVAFLSETKPRQFLDQMQSLGMPSMDYYLVRRLSIYPVNLRVDQERAERIMRKLLRYIEAAQGVDLIIFDSVTPLLFQFDARYVLSFLATCKDLAALGKTIIVTLHSYAINESLRLRADSIVDAHLRLRIEELGKQVVRTLEVAKIRGAVKTIANSVSFTVEPGIGLKTVPISKTKA